MTGAFSGLLLFLGFVGPVSAQFPEAALPTYSGRWVASAGESRIFHGKWVGQSIPGDPLAAHGSWTLAGPSGKTILTGSWKARIREKIWQGTWSAITADGRTVSGTWQANLDQPHVAVFENFFEEVARNETTGTWRSGKVGGAWRLDAKVRPGKDP